MTPPLARPVAALEWVAGYRGACNPADLVAGQVLGYVEAVEAARDQAFGELADLRAQLVMARWELGDLARELMAGVRLDPADPVSARLVELAAS